MNDIAYNLNLFEENVNELVVRTSFFRGVDDSEYLVKGELHELAKKGVHKKYSFSFTYTSDKETSRLDFDSDPNGLLPTNIHALIGNNGLGKTTFFKDILKIAQTQNQRINSDFEKTTLELNFNQDLVNNINDKKRKGIFKLFANFLFISFSAFDKFQLEHESNDKKIENKLNYVTLFKNKNENEMNLNEQFHLELEDLVLSSEKINDFGKALRKSKLFLDSQFESKLIEEQYPEFQEEELKKEKESLKKLFEFSSSGQKIILLTIVAIINKVKERTLVVFDEPELYLHPPMVSTLIRILSEIMKDYNGVCIMATHSPIILQEIPKECVHIIDPNSQFFRTQRPKNQTFGENLSALTDHIFGYDIRKTGFYDLIQNEYSKNKNFDKEITLGRDAENFLELLKLRDMEKEMEEE